MRFTLLTVAAALLMTSAAHAQLITAHRGASADAPENTRAAFELAWQQHADAIEADFHLSGDGQVVCIHDDNLKRVAGVDKRVGELTLEELRRCDVGAWKHEKWRGQRILTLAEVLALVPAGKRIFIELKTGPQIVEPTQAAIAASQVEPGQITFISFHDDTIRACKRRMPAIEAQWLTGFKRPEGESDWSKAMPSARQIAERVRACGADGVGIHGRPEVVTEPFVQELSAAGVKKFHVWTINEAALARRFAELGACGITTDKPAVMREAVK
jgi:glycerophosphoryl diester phosphodiesterase